jgi:hypothetical protein
MEEERPPSYWGNLLGSDETAVGPTVFKLLDYDSAFALRSCCRELRAAGYRHIETFTVTVIYDAGAANFRAVLVGLQKFQIHTLALENSNEFAGDRLAELVAAVTVSAL